MRRRPEDYPTVTIFHECGGVWFWAVDMPGNRRDISTAIAAAARRNERIKFYPAGEEPVVGAICKCFAGQRLPR